MPGISKMRRVTVVMLLVTSGALAQDQFAMSTALFIGSTNVTDSLTEGDTVTFWGRHSFSGLIESTLDLAWYIDGTETERTTYLTGATGFGSVSTLSGSWTATPGTHTLTFTVDPDNRFLETNEGNNEVSRQFTVQASTIPPDATTSIVPADGATGHPVQSNLVWNAGEKATGYLLSLGTNDPPSDLEYRTDLGNTTSYAPSGLEYSRTYYWQVIPTNSSGEATNCVIWSFTTEADPWTATSVVLYSENFDVFPLGITTGEITKGWENAEGDDGNWTVGSGSTDSGYYTGPTGDHTSVSGRYLFTESSPSGDPGSPDMTASLVSPEFTLDDVEYTTASIWAHMRGANMGSLHIDVFSGGIWTLDVTPAKVGEQGDEWFRMELPLTGFVSPLRIRIRGITGSGYKSDMAVDDFELRALVRPRLRQFGISEEVVSLSMSNLVKGATHAVLWSPSLTDPAWSTSYLFEAESNVYEHDMPVTNTHGFFKVIRE